LPLDPVDTLARLVSIPSVNPMGRTGSGAPLCEAELTHWLEETLGGLGLELQRQTVSPGRANLIARLDGDVPPERGGKVILLDAHQDTVPVEGMTIEPFRPKIEGGRLYGRGACDVKGGLAAILSAVSRLAAQRPRGMPTIMISCTVNEEYGFTGAAALTQLWSDGPEGTFPCRPDWALVAEPTGLNVVVAHKGVVRWRCHTQGRAGHSARPEAGENAIYSMARVLLEIETYARQVIGGGAADPLCGAGSLSVGTIQGGVSVNTVPDRCTIEIDCRLPPSQQPQDARQGLIDHLDRVVGRTCGLRHDPPLMEAPGLSDEANGALAERLATVVRGVAGKCRRVGAAYATNAAFYSAAGVPSVVFGPGLIEQAHTEDEWLPLEQLEQAVEIYCRFAGHEDSI
jgi:acetylornithine deacetylase/succinyl-diaminopimelate desuccinylase family protein